MKIFRCDSCHAEVTEYGRWRTNSGNRGNMYELKCVYERYENDSDNYDGFIFCHECIGKLLHKAEGED